MKQAVAIIGGGVSGLTCGVLLAERGYRAAIFAKETGQQTTSAAAAAVWYPYDVEPADKVIAWALETYNVLIGLGSKPGSGVSMIELRQFSRAGKIQIPDWAIPLGARLLPPFVIPGGVVESSGVPQSKFPPAFKSGFALNQSLIHKSEPTRQ
jgi:D-amino-acid oxidase